MNINIALDSNYFKPYTFLDVMAPGILFKLDWEADLERYLAIAESLGTLDSAVLNTDKAKGIYDSYKSDLDAAAEEFNSGKLNKSRLASLRNRYGTEIKKLETARDLMYKDVETRRAENKDGKRVYSNPNPTLDDYLNGIPESYTANTDDIIAKTSVEALSIVNALRKSISFNYDKRLDNAYWVLTVTSGILPSELDLILNTDLNDASLSDKDRLLLTSLHGLIDKERKANNYDKFQERELQKIDDAIITGMYGAFENPEYSTLRNPNSLNALQWEQYNALKNENNARQAAYNAIKSSKGDLEAWDAIYGSGSSRSGSTSKDNKIAIPGMVQLDPLTPGTVPRQVNLLELQKNRLTSYASLNDADKNYLTGDNSSFVPININKSDGTKSTDRFGLTKEQYEAIREGLRKLPEEERIHRTIVCELDPDDTRKVVHAYTAATDHIDVLNTKIINVGTETTGDLQD